MNAIENFILNNWDATIRFNPNDEGTCVGLPKPYTVPCISDKFQEMYYWDTYFTNVGLILSGRLDQAKNNVENVAYLIRKFGYMPNGNRTYYLSRSQPPFFSQMVREVYEQTRDKVWLAEMYSVVEMEYRFWMEKRLTDTGLNRYYGNTENLPEDVALELTQRFGIEAAQNDREHAHYTQCMQAFCECGWDCNSRFKLQAHLYNPVDLNALLYGLESNMAFFADELGKSDRQLWTDRANARKEKMVCLLWDSDDGCYYDYQFEAGKRGKVVSAAAFYPLMFGVAEPENAARVVKKLSVLEQEYGIAATASYPDNLDLQWDYPHGWACLQYIVIKGLLRYGYCKEAHRIAQKYCAVVEKNYATTQNIWEKYDTVSGGVSVTKEYESPQMMGWSAGVYLYCRKILENE